MTDMFYNNCCVLIANMLSDDAAANQVDNPGADGCKDMINNMLQ